jgi:hypothetical protein
MAEQLASAKRNVLCVRVELKPLVGLRGIAQGKRSIGDKHAKFLLRDSLAQTCGANRRSGSAVPLHQMYGGLLA